MSNHITTVSSIDSLITELEDSSGNLSIQSFGQLFQTENPSSVMNQDGSFSITWNDPNVTPFGFSLEKSVRTLQYYRIIPGKSTPSGNMPSNPISINSPLQAVALINGQTPICSEQATTTTLTVEVKVLDDPNSIVVPSISADFPSILITTNGMSRDTSTDVLVLTESNFQVCLISL
jgi:hypothetical protein